uniref:ATP synthase complex subunit 8 n=2 Tax=Cryptonatica TaxID=500157 RepID=A0A6G6D626_9CAEN|nr:ATP synthase F0 subunit 8 [Cryptonatica andoi]YP_009743670.1 ATP synthase F0 subunit 8 [Cryptonatica janthostoma]QID90409.1 ATP synthase F0 subunit 8 [Cryptonatica andoi]QIE11987.1 ATP synthase F0 subunit 8 [Cryptonatica janthostoma]
MPQLSPLNWIFLFVLFWAAVLVVSILIWWSKKIFFSAKVSSTLTVKENKWNW